MKILLIRPDPGNERFGLGPFFRVEPLGIEYLAQALRRLGHEPTIIDERFGDSPEKWVRRLSPQLVGIAALHALEYDEILRVARTVRRLSPKTYVVVGGPAAASYPSPLETPDLDAICMDDGEEVFPALVDALDHRRSTRDVPGFRLRTSDGWISTQPLSERTSLDRTPLPARDLVQRYRGKYHCLQIKPVWLMETARGCPYRCSFCAVWQLHNHTFRERSIGAVVEDFASTGENVFIIDDLFWNHAERSMELAKALKRKGLRKNWLLVQSRTDLVARNANLLEAWRPVARYFDIFFGLEGATDAALKSVTKDAGAAQSVEAARVARSMDYGVTGNFLVDPDWEEQDFQELWDFVARHEFRRAGYTILTPLPGTEYFRQMAPLLEGQPWFKYDMNHLLWEPRLGAKRFFELYAETWRRSVLNTAGDKKLLDWFKQVRLTEIPFIIKIMRRTQRMMNPTAYMAEHTACSRSCNLTPPARAVNSEAG